jgi:hypothetical protein
MKHWPVKTLVAVFIAIFVGILAVSNTVKSHMQSIYLGGARVDGQITWREAVLSREIVHQNEPNRKCIKVGCDNLGGTNVLYIFTLFNLYVVDEYGPGKWQLESKGPYAP